MPLNLMYITNRPEIARIAETAGVDRIFIDMEYIGKSERQAGMDTVQCHHSTDDIKNVKNAICQAEMMVRVNPIHNVSPFYCSSEKEIDAAVCAGADILMLPYFKTADEVERFVNAVGGRVRTMLLIETPEAVQNIDKILDINGIDELFIGLNDLSLGYGKRFMFELLADGTVEGLCRKFKQKGLPYGFGGIAAIGKGTLPSEYIIKEHYRLGSSGAILSRSFCNTQNMSDIKEIENTFMNGMAQIRSLEAECALKDKAYFDKNKQEIDERIKIICGG